MSATVSISVRWDGTVISITNIHDPESEGSPADSTTNAHDIIEMLRDCANRAEEAVAASLVPPNKRESRSPADAARQKAFRQKHGLLRSTEEAIICRCGVAFSTNAQLQGHLGVEER